MLQLRNSHSGLTPGPTPGLTPAEALEPRKTPSQRRSRATIDAVLEATLQVLLADGARRLTTTRVAARAGVSVGTLYQYFPHKQALLYAVLRRHLETVASAIETACARLHGQPAARLAEGLVGAYLDAKARRPDATRALYLVSAEFEISELRGGISGRIRAAVIELLGTVPDGRFEDLQAVSFTLLAAMSGAVRTLFECDDMPTRIGVLRRQLTLMCGAYLAAAAEISTP